MKRWRNEEIIKLWMGGSGWMMDGQKEGKIRERKD